MKRLKPAIFFHEDNSGIVYDRQHFCSETCRDAARDHYEKQGFTNITSGESRAYPKRHTCDRSHQKSGNPARVPRVLTLMQMTDATFAQLWYFLCVALFAYAYYKRRSL